MEYKIKVSNIPFFKYVTPGLAKRLNPSFKIKSYKKDQKVLSYGDEVPGFFIIVQGEITISTEHYESTLAVLKEGQGFGEMALLEGETASANVKASVESTKLLFCDSGFFKKLLNDDFVFAAAFYKGASSIISERLRRTNQLVEVEMKKTKNIIKDLMEAEGIVSKLRQTRVSIDGTGENLISKLTNTLPILNEIAKNDPDFKGKIEEIKSVITKVLTIDSQNFDIISQQVDRIHQYLLNMHKLLEGEFVTAIKGDQNIFTVDLDKGPVDSEDAITFF
ncbi:MAG: cyclic nucleotide-binding domain-containing protein [Spirochaetia bacterium]|nr:cyclic nucleotide-binding domain-containing protein [Spirochaetia bacterium]